MKVSRKMLDGAVRKQIISAEQADALAGYLESQSDSQPNFSFTHILYYFGGLVAIGAMTVFMSLGWQSFGGAAIVTIALIYAVIGVVLTNALSARQLAIPAGVCATFVVCLAPLAVYGLQEWLGVWPDRSDYLDFSQQIAWHRLYMEVATIAAAVVALWKYKFPFLVMPVAVALGVMTIDISEMIYGGDRPWQIRQLMTLSGGVVITAVALVVDMRSRQHQDYAFWLYLVGVTAFWGGLTALDSDSELSRFFYFCINLLMIAIGAVLIRRIFVVFGALGSCGYLGYLAFDVFEDSWLFPIVLTVIGLGIIYLGILWQRNERAITQQTLSLIHI